MQPSSHNSSRNNSPHVDLAGRRPSEASNSGKIEYSNKTADSKSSLAGIDSLNQKDVELCPFHNNNPNSEHNESTATPGHSLSHNIHLTPLGPNQKVTGGQQTRASGRPVDRSIQLARSVRFDVPPGFPTPVPSLPLKDMQCTNPHPRRRGSTPETVHKSTSPTCLLDRPWKYDRPAVLPKLLPQKRPSDQDIWTSSKKVRGSQD